MNVTLVVRVLNEENQIIGAYSRSEKLQFSPTIGMKFRVDSSYPLWRTADGGELDPPIKEVVYNLDEKRIYCLFDIDQFLDSTYWMKIRNIETNHDLKQFMLQADHEKRRADGALLASNKDASTGHKMATKAEVLLIPFTIVLFEVLAACFGDGIL